MSTKRSKPMLLSSARKIRRARKMLREMPMRRQIDLLVQSGALTEEQAERARKKLAEVEA